MADKFDELKVKYGPAVTLMKDLGVAIQKVEMKANRLYIEAVAPSQEKKNQVWDEIKILDEKYEDLICDITVEAQSEPAQPAQPEQRIKSYVVQRGDTLAKIAKAHYGDANEYMKIFDANKDTIDDPNLIRPGMILNIPLPSEAKKP